ASSLKRSIGVEMKRTLMTVVISGILAPAAVLAQVADQPAPRQSSPNTAASQGTAQSQPITAADFVTQATSSNLFEVQSSQLALERSKNEQIRQFAQRMVKDHTDAMNRMKSAAQGQQIPGEPAQQHSQMLEQLRNAE